MKRRKRSNRLQEGTMVALIAVFALVMGAIAARQGDEPQPEAASQAGKQGAAHPTLDVMTFNIRFAHGPPNSWEERRPVVKALLEKYSPDVMGTQEGVNRQLRDLQEDLPAYAWIGEGRDGGDRGEYMAIFYRRDRFDALEHEHFWLSDTPGVAGSFTWGNRLPRMVTWVKLRDRSAQCTFYVVNTHFDHEAQAAREKSADLLIERAKQFGRALPVILLGDFNSAAGANPVYARLTQEDAFVDVWRALGKPEPPFGTYHEFQGEARARELGFGRIDWILTRGAVEARSAEILTFAHGKQYPSDHFPVMAQLELKACRGD
jgi:endonuclease/exonuclease/phosphatase family metal-dependent hydrolase